MLGDIERFVVTAFIDQCIEAIDELLFLFAIAGHAIVEQAPFAGRGQLFFVLRIEFVFDDGRTLGFAERDLQLVGELCANVGRELRGALDVLQRELEILHRRFGIAAHRLAGIDDGVLDLAPQHLAEDAALLLNFIEQCALAAN